MSSAESITTKNEEDKDPVEASFVADEKFDEIPIQVPSLIYNIDPAPLNTPSNNNTNICDCSEAIGDVINTIVNDLKPPVEDNPPFTNGDFLEVVECHRRSRSLVVTPQTPTQNVHVDTQIVKSARKSLNFDDEKSPHMDYKLCATLAHSLMEFSYDGTNVLPNGGLPMYTAEELAIPDPNLQVLNEFDPLHRSSFVCSGNSQDHLMPNTDYCGGINAVANLNFFPDVMPLEPIQTYTDKTISIDEVSPAENIYTDEGFHLANETYLEETHLVTGETKSGPVLVNKILCNATQNDNTYSPSRLLLSEAFEKMKLNSTSEDTFVSCNQSTMLSPEDSKTQEIVSPRAATLLPLEEQNQNSSPGYIIEPDEYFSDDVSLTYEETRQLEEAITKDEKEKYLRYLDLKLEITRTQQEIAVSKLKIRQNECEMIKIQPHKMRLAELLKQDQNKMTQIELTLLEAEKEISRLEGEKVKYGEDINTLNMELQAAHAKEIKYQALLVDIDNVAGNLAEKIKECEAAYKFERQKVRDLHEAHGILAKKYEQVKHVILGMKVNENTYRTSVEMLREEFKKLTALEDALHQEKEGEDKENIPKN